MSKFVPNVKRKAFTLIELLVVISIIALLMAILMPALGRARKQAQVVVCGTQSRTLIQSSHLYAADNNDYGPRGSMDTSQGWRAWDESLLPYIDLNFTNYEIFCCPAMTGVYVYKGTQEVSCKDRINEINEEKDSDGRFSGGTLIADGYCHAGTYRMNIWLSGSNYFDKYDTDKAKYMKKDLRMGEIPTPSNAVMFAEYAPRKMGNSGEHGGMEFRGWEDVLAPHFKKDVYDNGTTKVGGGDGARPHEGRTTLTFTDGSVKSLKWKMTSENLNASPSNFEPPSQNARINPFHNGDRFFTDY